MSPRTRTLTSEELSWSIPSLREPRYSQSLERGLAILSCFTPARPVLGIAAIADELGMSRSTTHRYVITLVALGYLQQGASRKYRLGLAVTNLGMAALSSTSLREHAHHYLQELSRQSAYTVSLAVLEGTEIFYVDRVRGHRRAQQQVDLGLNVGSRIPAYCTAMGKILLAYLPTSERRELIAQMTRTKRTPNTIVGKRALEEELASVLEEGLAINDQELAPELHAIAAPVRNVDREVIAAISISAHSSTIALEDLVEHLGPHLIATADRISARLGYRRDDER